MKRFLEKAVKWLLTASGFVTSLVILLIIGFLFTEGAGLFREKVIEEGYVLAVHVFDEDITRWSELGGPDMEIVTFRLEDADEYFTEEELGAQYEYAAGKIDSLIAATPGMIAFIPESMVEEGAQLNFIEDNAISPAEVLGGSEWFPTATPAPLFGMWAPAGRHAVGELLRDTLCPAFRHQHSGLYGRGGSGAGEKHSQARH